MCWAFGQNVLAISAASLGKEIENGRTMDAPPLLSIWVLEVLFWHFAALLKRKVVALFIHMFWFGWWHGMSREYLILCFVTSRRSNSV